MHPGYLHFAFSHRAFLDGDYQSGLKSAQQANLPGWFWYHANLAMNLARLGRAKEAREQVELVRKVYPGYENAAYKEWRKWLWNDDEIERCIQGLREAGMNIPPDSPKQ